MTHQYCLACQRAVSSDVAAPTCPACGFGDLVEVFEALHPDDPPPADAPAHEAPAPRKRGR